jgi:hypothetical protein
MKWLRFCMRLVFISLPDDYKQGALWVCRKKCKTLYSALSICAGASGGKNCEKVRFVRGVRITLAGHVW